MSDVAWYSQLFENESGGGVLLALPYEAIGSWAGGGEKYDSVVDEIDQFLCRPLGRSVGLFVTDETGVNEAHWMRFKDRPGVMLVVWVEWADPSRSSLPEDMKRVADVWASGEDPRQPWLENRLRSDDIDWDLEEPIMSLASGVLLFGHAERRPLKARFAKPNAVATSDHLVPVGVTPGKYVMETTFINELPDGAHCCLVCRWTPVD